MLPLQFIMLPLQFIMSPEQFIKLPLQFHVKDANVNKFSGTNYLSLYMRFWYLWHQEAAKAQVSLPIWADSPEPWLLAYTKIRC